jgi:hypothetical protein
VTESAFAVNHVFEAFVCVSICVREVAVALAQFIYLQAILQYEFKAVLRLPVATAIDRNVDPLVAV